jgi:hypothetical protein
MAATSKRPKLSGFAAQRELIEKQKRWIWML